MKYAAPRSLRGAAKENGTQRPYVFRRVRLCAKFRQWQKADKNLSVF
jgi:hypothetical protein